MTWKSIIQTIPGSNGALSIPLGTRSQTLIDNETRQRDLKPSPAVCQLEQEWEKRYERRAPQTSGYNCHGHAFACRRTAIYEPKLIEIILQDDEYAKVEMPRSGDIAIYRDPETKAIEHAGVVASTSPDEEIRVLSKFSDMTGEFLHDLRDHELPFYSVFPRTIVEFWSERRDAVSARPTRGEWRKLL